MAKINYLSLKSDIPATGYWDHTFLRDILEELPDSDRTIFVIPGAYQWDIIPEINKHLSAYPKVLVIVTSDEENKFNMSALEHPDMIKYSQYGSGGIMFPLGYTPHTRENLKKLGYVEKDVDWYFAGQVTHLRREMLVKELGKLSKSKGDCLVETNGFAQGVRKDLYIQALAKTKVAPCPSGTVSVDSFRVYEALEAGAIPIVDDVSPLRSGTDQYWRKMFGDVAFPIYTDPSMVPQLVQKCLDNPDSNNQVYAWWINKKYQVKARLRSRLGLPEEKMAVIIPISPIASHPDTHILEETIASVRVHTDAPIVLTFDGVRKEQADMADNYRKFISKMLWKCNFEYKNVLPILFSHHVHQSGMMKYVLSGLDVPYILYVEHDTPLTPDREIPLEQLMTYIHDGTTNLIRFHFEVFIPEPHRHLMKGFVHNGAPLLKTTQWSQRPLLASTEYYRRIMKDHFSENANTFIEDVMHSVCQVEPWENHKLTIYHPSGDIKRSYHLDGRAGGKKYDDRLIF